MEPGLGRLVIFGLPWGYFALAVVVGIVGSARLTRLVVADSYPPIAWVKGKWDRWSEKTERRKQWWVLPNCPWCFAPYVTAGAFLWAWLDVRADGDLDWPWWAFWGWLAASYVASWLVFHDEDGSDE